MIKIAALTAAVFLIAWAITLVIAFKTGRKVESRSPAAMQFRLYRDMAEFINRAVNGTSLDGDYWSSMSPETLKRAGDLLDRYQHFTNR
jgi:hypothetical protein